jgi:hypothetical protein
MLKLTLIVDLPNIKIVYGTQTQNWHHHAA